MIATNYVEHLTLDLYTMKCLAVSRLQDSDSEKETEQDFESNSVRGQPAAEKSYDRTPDIVLRPRKSRFRDADSPESHSVADESPSTAAIAPAAVPKRSRDEIMQDVVSVEFQSSYRIPLILLITQQHLDIHSVSVENQY